MTYSYIYHPYKFRLFSYHGSWEYSLLIDVRTVLSYIFLLDTSPLKCTASEPRCLTLTGHGKWRARSPGATKRRHESINRPLYAKLCYYILMYRKLVWFRWLFWPNEGQISEYFRGHDVIYIIVTILAIDR